MSESPIPPSRSSGMLSRLGALARARPETPLVRYLFNDFDVVATAGSFEFMLPKGEF